MPSSIALEQAGCCCIFSLSSVYETTAHGYPSVANGLPCCRGVLQGRSGSWRAKTCSIELVHNEASKGQLPCHVDGSGAVAVTDADMDVDSLRLVLFAGD